MTVERLLDKFIPSQAQVKEVFNTIPQYAFQVSSTQCRCWDCWGSLLITVLFHYYNLPQDIPEQPRLSPSRFSAPGPAPERSPRPGLAPRSPRPSQLAPPSGHLEGGGPALSPPRPARHRRPNESSPY